MAQRSNILVLGLVLWLVYALLSVTAPAMSGYVLTDTQRFLIRLTISLPLLAIWLIAINGVGRIKNYASQIKESTDGVALNSIANGLAFVVFAFIFQTLLGSIASHLAGTETVNLIVLVRNHLPIVMTLFGFFLILKGARGLVRSVDALPSKEHLLALMLPYIILSTAFGWLFYNQVERVVTAGVPNFATGGKLPFFTTAIPVMISWLIGILAVLYIIEYARQVKGVIYRQALRDLVRGIALAIVFSIVLQLFTVAGRYFGKLELGPILVIVYLLLLLYALGFIFISRGSKKLARIEEAL